MDAAMGDCLPRSRQSQGPAMSDPHARLGAAFNMRGAVFMVLSMAGFAVEDQHRVRRPVWTPISDLITVGVKT